MEGRIPEYAGEAVVSAATAFVLDVMA